MNNRSPRCNWTSLTSRVLDLRCRASWQAAVTTLSMKSSAICSSIWGRTRITSRCSSTEQLGLCRKDENEPSAAGVSQVFATIAVSEPSETPGCRNGHRWLKAAANVRIHACNTNPPCPGHRATRPWETPRWLFLQPLTWVGTYFLHVFIQLLVRVHLTHQVLQFLLG